MALTDKEKKGIGFLVSAIFFAVIGLITLLATGIPMWVPVIFDAVILVAGAFGIIAIVKPET